MAANSTTVTAPGTISPKVFWPLVVGVGLTFVASFLAALTPDMLAVLGPFAVPTAISLGVVAQTLTAYMKSDELRDLGVQATAAVLPVYDQVTPPPLPEVVQGEGVGEPADPERDVPAGGGAHRASLSDEVANIRKGGVL